jgi:hypothetical protein
LTTSPNFGTNLLLAERPPTRRHHFGTPGDIISESAGDFVGICSRRLAGVSGRVRARKTDETPEEIKQDLAVGFIR